MMVEQSEIDVKIDELEILVEEYKILLPKIAEFYNRIANSSEIIHHSIKDSILSAIELSRNFSNTFDKNLLMRKCKEDNKYGISFLHDVDFIIENLIEMTKLYRAPILNTYFKKNLIHCQILNLYLTKQITKYQ